MYYFDKNKYPVVGEWIDDIAGPVPSPTDWESMCSVASEYNDTCIIAECTVGGSYNDVERDSSFHGQVLTSIRIDKIHKIYSPDSTVTIKEGQSAYVIEPYCYVDDSTPTLKERCQGKEGIFTLSSYSPLVAGKYIMFLCSDDDYYQYTNVSAAKNALFLRPFPNGGAYQIADAEEVESNCISVDYYFWKLWADTMELYTDRADATEDMLFKKGYKEQEYAFIFNPIFPSDRVKYCITEDGYLIEAGYKSVHAAKLQAVELDKNVFRTYFSDYKYWRSYNLNFLFIHADKVWYAQDDTARSWYLILLDNGTLFLAETTNPRVTILEQQGSQQEYFEIYNEDWQTWKDTFPEAYSYWKELYNRYS